MGNPGVLPDLFDGNLDVLGLADDDTAVGADAASPLGRIAGDRQRRLAAAEVIHILTHHRFKRDVRRGVGKGQRLAVVTIGRESRDIGVCCRISAFGVKQSTVFVPVDLSAARSAVGQGQFVFGVFEAGEDKVVSRLTSLVLGDQAAVLDVDLGISGRAEPHAAALLIRIVINNASVFDMERAIDKILVAFAIYAATHIPGSIALDLARAERNVIRIGIDASAGRSGVTRYGATFHSESGMVPATLLQAAIDHAHSAAFAIRIRNIVLDLAALQGKLGIPLDVHCTGGSSIPKFIALVAHKLTASHLKGGSLVPRLAIHDHRAALIASVVFDTAAAHVKTGIAHQHDAGRRKVISSGIRGGGSNVILTNNAALHDNMGAVLRVDNTAIRVLQFALLDNAARHGKRGLVSRHVDDTSIDVARSAVAHNGLVREHNRSLARNNGALVVATPQGHVPREFKGCPLGNIDQYGDAAPLLR